MAIYVPAKWTQMIWTIAYFVFFVLLIIWNAMIKNPYRYKIPMVLSLLFFMTFAFMFPASEGFYAYDKDTDPWNSAPYLQWYCITLRFMTLTTMSLYLTQICARYLWEPKSPPARAIKYCSAGILIVFVVFSTIIVFDKANEFENKKPYQVFTFLLDWLWPFVAVVATAISARVRSRYALINKRNGGGSGAEIPPDIEWDATFLQFLNMYLFAGTLVYAILNVVNRDKFMGTFEYYFQQEEWIETIAPYFVFIFVLSAYIFFLGILLRFIITYNREAYGKDFPSPYASSTGHRKGGGRRSGRDYGYGYSETEMM